MKLSALTIIAEAAMVMGAPGVKENTEKGRIRTLPEGNILYSRILPYTKNGSQAKYPGDKMLTVF